MPVTMNLDPKSVGSPVSIDREVVAGPTPILGTLTEVDLGKGDSSILGRSFGLASLLDGRLRIVAPIQVRVYEDAGQIVAEADEIDEFGSGETAGEAIADLQRLIADLYLEFAADESRLGPGLRPIWDILRAKIRKLG